MKGTFTRLWGVMLVCATTGSVASTERFGWEPPPVVDVIVVGGGGAGLSAAVTVAEQGLSVWVLEKMPAIGGNTLRASGLFNAVDPQREPAMGEQDTAERYYSQMILSGGGESSPAVVKALVDHTYPTLKWLESLGLKFRPQTVVTWGAEWPRGHKPLEPRGQGYIRVLSSTLLTLGGKIHTNTRVVGLLRDETGRIAGVTYAVETPSSETRSGSTKPQEVRSRYGVVLASGGFAANPTLVKRYAPQYADLPTDNNPGNTGDLLAIAKGVGAQLVGLENIQVVPGAPPGQPFQVRLDLDASRFILVDHQGHRFIDEDEPRDALARAVVDRLKAGVFSITNQATLDSFDVVTQRDIYKGLETGSAFRAETLEALAQAIHVPVKALKTSVEQFNQEAIKHTGKCARAMCTPLSSGPFWASPLSMTVHSTMGGVVIDPLARVLNAKGEPIAGLYAAGEVTGNVHGANRIGGNGIADAITFGRIAGRELAREAKALANKK